MNQLTLELFGAFQVTCNQQPVVGFESNKVRALLAYLAVESSQRHSRTTLAGLFWPEFREVNARDNLRHTLTNLRKLLQNDLADPPFLLIDRQSVQFNTHSNYQCDVAEFVRWVATNPKTASAGAALDEHIAHLARAVTLYQGPFLQGFFLNDCSAFEEWLLLTRERLHNQMLTALATLSTHFEEQQEYAKAERYARQWVALDNLEEQAHCSLMRLLALRGQRSAALSQYEQCRQLLAKELGVTPHAETIALHQQIQRGLWERNQMSRLRSAPAPPSKPPTAAPQHHLPVPITSFVGRTREVAAICDRLRQPQVRLLTLHGVGGVGKTRLALQAARQLLSDFSDGCAWVELAPLQAAAQLPMALVQSLGLSEGAGLDPLQRLKNYLRTRSLLLVMDNYEHLLDAASLVAELLKNAEHLKCLVTSREPLHLQGEHEFPVPVLTLPTADQLASLADVAQSEAVQLFTQRAQAVRPDFTLDPANASTLAEICARLDGLPLALELAAARCKFFSPQALLAKLATTRLTFLRGTRDMPNRHQTLRDVIAWSYNLLDPAERKLFQRLAVFVGGFTIEDATRVCTLGETDALDVPELLISLADKNLIRQEMANGDDSRFLLLETMREFGLQTLAESATLWGVQEHHAAFYCDLANVLCPQLMGANGVRSMAQLRQEYPNLRAALQWLLANQKVEQSLRLCNMLLYYWTELNGNEALGYLEAALRLAADSPVTPEYINALANAGYASLALDVKGSGQAYFEQCLALNQAAGNVGDPVKIGTANGLLGWIRFDQGDYQAARAYLATAKENDIAMGAEWALAMTIANQGTMAARLGEFDEAQRLLQEALARHRRLGDVSMVAGVLLRQATAYVLQKRFAEAADCVTQSAAIGQEIRTDSWLAEFYRISAHLAFQRDEQQQANQLRREALLLRQKQGVPRYLLPILETTILIVIGQKDYHTGLVLASAITAYRQKQHIVAPPVEKQLIDDAISLARQALTPEAATAAWATGAAMTLDEAMTYALA
ncbi:MAG: BTAD domain-containing putative transcriptional regulator [Caldilineaceae bacterium]